MRTYHSFVVRHWRLATDQVRVMVEHVQTGQRAALDSLAEAAA